MEAQGWINDFRKCGASLATFSCSLLILGSGVGRGWGGGGGGAQRGRGWEDADPYIGKPPPPLSWTCPWVQPKTCCKLAQETELHIY